MELRGIAPSRRVGWAGAAVAGVVLTALLAGSAVSGGAVADAAEAAPSTANPSEAAVAAAPEPSPLPGIRNIVFVVADDLDTATFEQVRRLRELHDRGMSFESMVVTDSLCCPSRASILRSQYVHNHGVLSNLLTSGGGWATFAEKGDEADCLPVWLKAAGVHTAFLGKYLNGYGEEGDPTAIPPGWDHWFVPTTKSGMYRGYGYTVNDNGRLVTHANKTRDFLPDVLIREAKKYLRTAQSPFYLQVNTTSPHDPAPVANRHAGSHKSARIPRTKSFNSRGANEPAWRAKKHRIGPKRMQRYQQYWRQRVQSTESVADTVSAVIRSLRQAGTLDETLVVVGSDNGFHVANRRLSPGKRTPYKEDTVVPTIFIGPGIAAGSSTGAVTSTIDLGPTFAQLLGATIPSWVDGRSLVPLLVDPAASAWRTGALSESLGDSAFNDPDYQAFKPPKFHALRTQKWLYVEYEDGSRELFDRVADPAEVNNIVDSTPMDVVAALSRHLRELTACSGETCRAADTWSDV